VYRKRKKPIAMKGSDRNRAGTHMNEVTKAKNPRVIAPKITAE